MVDLTAPEAPADPVPTSGDPAEVVIDKIYTTGGGSTLVTLGILFFSLSVVFTIITLPVEFNASRRAIRLLADDGFLDSDEIGGAKRVLSAAAMTYVAAAFAAIAQLLRLVAIFGRRND